MSANDIILADDEPEPVKTDFTDTLPCMTSHEEEFLCLLKSSNEQLCLLAQSGNSLALSALAEKNKRLINKIANKVFKHHSGTCFSIEDLIQEGSLELLALVIWYCYFSIYLLVDTFFDTDYRGLRSSPTTFVGVGIIVIVIIVLAWFTANICFIHFNYSIV